MQYSSLVPTLIKLCQDAGEIIMRHYETDIVVERKEDNSPVTLADKEADVLISNALKNLTPEIPVISEEGDFSNLKPAKTYWLVDPVDGTKSFINKEGQFTVNIGLIQNGVPTFGVIYIPAKKMIYYTGESGGAFRQEVGFKPEQIECANNIDYKNGYRVVASKSHRNQATEDYLASIKVQQILQSASSLKFCLIAEGRADIYPRLAPTMQWDTAAGHAILNAAGGCVLTPEGEAFKYLFETTEKQDFLNGHFIAKGF